MITPKFIAYWFIASAVIFFLLMVLIRAIEHPEAQPDRDLNTFMILLSQGLGAALAYALYS